MQVQSFNTENIHCINCEGRVKKLLLALDGIKQVDVNVLRKTMRVEFDASIVSSEQIISTMVDAGYGASLANSAGGGTGDNVGTVIPSMPKNTMQVQSFNTDNIHCTNCEGRVKKLLLALDGIKQVDVNVLRKTMRVEFDASIVSSEQIISTMVDAGYGASLANSAGGGTGDNVGTIIPSMPKSTMQTQSFNTENIHCTNCEGRVKKLLLALDGVEQVDVNILRKTMRVEFDANLINPGQIIFAMQHAGYGANTEQGDMEGSKGASKDLFIPTMQYVNQKAKAVPTHSPSSISSKHNDVQASEKKNHAHEDKYPLPLNLKVSLVLAALLMYVAMGDMLSLPLPSVLTSNLVLLAFVQLILCAPILYVNRKIFSSGLGAALDRSPNMDTLVGLGSGAAALFGLYALIRMLFTQDVMVILHWGHNLYFDSAGMILALIGLGKHFESRARGRASQAIDKLTRLVPNIATCIRDGVEVQIPTHEVIQGDILIVQAGQSIAADGVIVQGYGFIDESAITGESLPVEKQVGQNVIGATVSTSGYFQMRVTGVGEQTTLARIIRLVDDALSTKAPIARLADKISAIFVPIIIIVAMLSFIVWIVSGYGLEFAMSTAISVLVISCPCALGLATPTAIMVGTGIGAERGILFKSAAAIERAQSADTVVLDKTGTITFGKPKVTDIVSLNSTQEEELLRLAASLERLSEHPLGKAIVEEAEQKSITLISPEQFTEFKQIPGLGLSAKQGDDYFVVGNARLLAYEEIVNHLEDKENSLSKQGKTVLYFAKNNSLLGLIAVADSIKPNSAKAVQELQNLGLDVLMLTGDNVITAQAVQEELGIKEIMAQVLPEEKESKVRELQNNGHIVMMVGDGINDAPALARADVGIAIGAGTDIAIQSADMVLMRSDVEQVVSAYKLSKAVMRTIMQNLFWAFAYNIILIPVAAGLLYMPWKISLNPMLAAASMSLSSLTVVGNALRLRSKKI